LGGSTTGKFILNPNNSIAGGYVAPNTTNVTDLGTASLIWRNIFGGTIAGTTLTQGGNGVCDSSGANCPSAEVVAVSGGFCPGQLPHLQILLMLNRLDCDLFSQIALPTS